MAAKLNQHDLGMGYGKPRGKYVLEKPPLILNARPDSFEFNPMIKEDATKTFCSGLVMGYKLNAAKDQRVWAHINSAGATDSEKQARGILIASSWLCTIGLTNSSKFKGKPIGPWCILTKDAVVNMGLLLEDGEEEDPDEMPNYYSSRLTAANEKKIVAALENYCNIKVQTTPIAISGIIDKPGVLA